MMDRNPLPLRTPGSPPDSNPNPPTAERPPTARIHMNMGGCNILAEERGGPPARSVQAGGRPPRGSGAGHAHPHAAGAQGPGRAQRREGSVSKWHKLGISVFPVAT